MEKQNYLLDVKLKETLGSKLFTKNYEVELTKEFVEDENPKAHNFINHVKAFVERLKQNNQTMQKQVYKKWDVYAVHHNMNT